MAALSGAELAFRDFVESVGMEAIPAAWAWLWLGISRQNANEAMKSGRIPVIRRGFEGQQYRVVRVEDLRAYADNRGS